jgi:CRP-like cAMP-binding protein
MTDLEQTLRFFSSAHVLRELDEAGRRRMIDASEAITFPDGAEVVREGEPGDALYIIVEGIASVFSDDLGTQKAIAELTDGTIFGEMAVITSQPRSATVTARGELKVLKIPKNSVLDILKDYPKVRELVARIGLARTEDTMEKMLKD